MAAASQDDVKAKIRKTRLELQQLENEKAALVYEQTRAATEKWAARLATIFGSTGSEVTVNDPTRLVNDMFDPLDFGLSGDACMFFIVKLANGMTIKFGPGERRRYDVSYYVTLPKSDKKLRLGARGRNGNLKEYLEAWTQLISLTSPELPGQLIALAHDIVKHDVYYSHGCWDVGGIEVPKMCTILKCRESDDL